MAGLVASTRGSVSNLEIPGNYYNFMTVEYEAGLRIRLRSSGMSLCGVCNYVDPEWSFPVRHVKRGNFIPEGKKVHWMQARKQKWVIAPAMFLPELVLYATATLADAKSATRSKSRFAWDPWTIFMLGWAQSVNGAAVCSAYLFAY